MRPMRRGPASRRSVRCGGRTVSAAAASCASLPFGARPDTRPSGRAGTSSTQLLHGTRSGSCRATTDHRPAASTVRSCSRCGADGGYTSRDCSVGDAAARGRAARVHPKPWPGSVCRQPLAAPCVRRPAATLDRPPGSTVTYQIQIAGRWPRPIVPGLTPSRCAGRATRARRSPARLETRELSGAPVAVVGARFG